MVRAAVNGGIAITICTDVQNIVHTKNGTLPHRHAGARMLKTVAMKLIPAAKRSHAADQEPQPQIGGLLRANVRSVSGA